MRNRGWVPAILLAASGAILSPALTLPALGQAATPPATTAAPQGLTAEEWAKQIWAAAAGGDKEVLLTLLNQAPADAADPAVAALAESVDLLEANIGKREAQRVEQIKKVNEEFDKALADGDSDLSLSKALKSAIELHMLSLDKAAVLGDERVVKLIEKADAAAKAAEARGDWFMSNELYLRLHSLLDESGEYKDDLERGARRLAIIRLYAPERFWELRNQRRIAEGESPLPPYNGVGDDFREKLAGINSRMVVKALDSAAQRHVGGTAFAQILQGGIEGVRTLVSTSDLESTFPELRDAKKKSQFLAFLAEQQARIEQTSERTGSGDLYAVVGRITEMNRKTLGLPDNVILHEFGNGAMASLDEFSAIIWPDEIRRFERSTEAKFVGVGIQIQLDELLNIKVVTPLEGTPAQRAGVRAGDLIKKVNGKPTVGFTLDQAVDVITGPSGTDVVLTVEREVEGAEEPTEIDFQLTRAEIPIYTVKGWRKLSAREDDWDWFVDRENKIGYIRLTQFSENTDREFDRAVSQMKAEGVRGLILDLRFNPGGLLEQAVAITSRFVDPAVCRTYQGVVVSTAAPNGLKRLERALRGCASLNDVPVAVLINEGAASASEIVSGAIQDYAKAGDIKAVLVGQRSFGKGSVQNVWQLTADSALKLTTQYYRLPGDRLIHRTPGAETWGVDPDLQIEMLPEQIADAFKLRQDLDVVRLDENGRPLDSKDAPQGPEALIEDGLDLQLQTALVLLQSQALAQSSGHVLLDQTMIKTNN